MRAAALLVSILLGAAACGPGKGVDPSAYANLPPQDTLAGGLAPAPSTATGGGAATPVRPDQPLATDANAPAGTMAPAAGAEVGRAVGSPPGGSGPTPAVSAGERR